jgi:hypothetical protein
LDIIKTSDENEYALATYKGLSFIEIDPSFNFNVIEQDERYFEDCWVKGLQEIEYDKFIVSVDGDSNIYILDRI